MIQLGLVIVALILLITYLRKIKANKPEKKHPPLPSKKVDVKIELFKQEMMEFLKELKGRKTQTRIKRLDIEIERLHKVRQLDVILEKAEKETNPQKAIDCYLEGFSFITKNKFELNRKEEIEEKIRSLQQVIDTNVRSRR
ncbi:MAG: hypothetical protein U9O41_07360 [Candidatus Aerophobetes bacterium]|nr:hypothetical protein [Candidatus Aerophobetes bacterium]